MKITFVFEGRVFDLVAGEQTHLVVDGDLIPGISIQVVDKKCDRLEQSISRREQELERCRACGRARRSDLRQMEESLRFMRDVAHHNKTGEPW